MAIMESWLPPSQENWKLINFLWQFFPVFTLFQWMTDWYPQGKTSSSSRLNLPGKFAWAAMETPGLMVLLYCMFTIPANQGLDKLPPANWLMAALFTIHYTYRALISPLFLNPSMSPIHPFILLSALCFQVINGACIGGYLAGYGPTTLQDWAGTAPRIEFGMMLFMAGLIGNIYHDDELREIRRASVRNQKRKADWQGEKSKGGKVDKLYMVPENGLFRAVLYPHYLCEWIEWCGFWVIGGLACTPARTFLVNELTTMLPRALNGKRWYVERFGKEKVGSRKALLCLIIEQNTRSNLEASKPFMSMPPKAEIRPIIGAARAERQATKVSAVEKRWAAYNRRPIMIRRKEIVDECPRLFSLLGANLCQLIVNLEPRLDLQMVSILSLVSDSFALVNDMG
ncbi:MAG: hypothetical protein Q9170_005188 [Blastenia crenularia]